ncbi:hypothetical protein VTN96DRAFT_1178 [Rasamsonia emersonii]
MSGPLVASSSPLTSPGGRHRKTGKSLPTRHRPSGFFPLRAATSLPTERARLIDFPLLVDGHAAEYEDEYGVYISVDDSIRWIGLSWYLCPLLEEEFSGWSGNGSESSLQRGLNGASPSSHLRTAMTCLQGDSQKNFSFISVQVTTPKRWVLGTRAVSTEARQGQSLWAGMAVNSIDALIRVRILPDTLDPNQPWQGS